jgi:hypothetical protein
MVSDEPIDDLTATVATGPRQLKTDQIAEYWNLVRRCLSEVFDKAEYEADALIGNMRARTEALTEEEVLLLYHNNPLQIGANLAGASGRPLTADEKLKYVAIMSENRDDRPAGEDVVAAYPDDLRFHQAVNP